MANRLHLLPTSVADLESGMYQQVPGGARAEAERRRYVYTLEAFEHYLMPGPRSAMALKALDQRVANASPAAGSSANSPANGSAPPAAQENGSAPESESQQSKA